MAKKTEHNGITNDLYIGSSDSLKTVYLSRSSSELVDSEVEYDPYKYRNVKKATTYFETLVHVMKCSLGTGILAMPSAMADAGYLLGTVGTFFVGFLCTYCVHMLISCEYEMCKRNKKPSMSYPETAEAALNDGPRPLKVISKYATLIVNISLVIYEIGSCGVYVVFIATNIKDVVNYYEGSAEGFSTRLYCVFVLPVLLLVNSVRNYKYMAPLSTLATFLSIISFGIVFYYLFSEMPDLSGRYPIGPIEKIPLFFATVVFAIEAMGVVFPLENEMKNPKKFLTPFGVLNAAMVPITILYACVGLFGFLRFGRDVQGSITLSLPQEKILSQAVKIMLSISVTISHSVLLHPAIDIIWGDCIKKHVKNGHLFWEYAVRYLTVTMTFCLAIIGPYFELLIPLIGALCLSMLGLFFPAVIQLSVYWNSYRGRRFALFVLTNGLIALSGLLCLGFGVKSSLEGIAHEFLKETSVI